MVLFGSSVMVFLTIWDSASSLVVVCFLFNLPFSGVGIFAPVAWHVAHALLVLVFPRFQKEKNFFSYAIVAVISLFYLG